MNPPAPAPLVHYRLHETGKKVRTFCGLVQLRSKTKKFRRHNLGVGVLGTHRHVPAFARDLSVDCPDCLQNSLNWSVAGSAKPPTLRRMSAFLAASSDRQWRYGTVNPHLAALDAAIVEGQLAGEEINAKKKALAAAVARAAAAIVNQKRKLKIAKTFLKKAEQRHARLLKRLQKAPTFTPVAHEEEGTDHDDEELDEGREADATEEGRSAVQVEGDAGGPPFAPTGRAAPV